MHQYFFILGREPQLSVTEIWRWFSCQPVRVEHLALTKTYLIVNTETALDLTLLQEQLGGMVKSGEVFAVTDNAEDKIADVILKKLVFNSGRLYFGFSWYGRAPAWFKGLGLKFKRQLKDKGRVRFVVSREATLSSVTVQKNHLLPPQGYEIVFLPDNNKVYLGQTITVQPFADFSERDYGRPGRDAKVGMLPPKLARLMINLAGGDKINSLLDPFCGTGTVIQEAALSGVKKLVGSDINSQQIKHAATNWRWLKTKRGQVVTEASWLTSPVEELPKKLANQKFDAIVCEPDLGPPLTGSETESKITSLSEDLKLKYQAWLYVLSQLLLPDGVMVMIWPAFIKGGQIKTLALDEALARAALKFSNIIPNFVPADWLSKRGTLMYYRPGQKVAREIVVLEKK